MTRFIVTTRISVLEIYDFLKEHIELPFSYKELEEHIPSNVLQIIAELMVEYSYSQDILFKNVQDVLDVHEIKLPTTNEEVQEDEIYESKLYTNINSFKNSLK